MVYLITSGTSSHDSLRQDYFEPSLNRCEPVEWLHFQKRSQDPGNFMEGEWLDSVGWATRNALNATKIVPQDQVMVIADLDIVWLPGAFSEIERIAESGIWAMRECKEGLINTGIIATKNTPAFTWLLEQLLEEMNQTEKHDQDALRAIAGERINLLPASFANTKTKSMSKKKDILCYHAICSIADNQETSIDKKVKLLDKFIEGISIF